MPEPNEFTPSGHLKDVYRKTYNKIVDKVFKDIDTDDLDLPIGVSRASLKKACKVRSDDSQILINNRSNLFHVIMRQARDYHPAIIGNYFTEMNDSSSVSNKVQIYLYFEDLDNDLTEGYDPTDGRISFRLINETSNTITKSKLTTIANRIKAEFGLGDGFIWKKGRSIFTYTEPEKGYRLWLLVRNEADGKEIVTKVLDLNNHTPDWKFANYKQNQDELDAFPYNPGSQIILGESYKKPRRRPMVNVTFRYALAYIYGVRIPIPLYDKSFTYLNALVDD